MMRYQIPRVTLEVPSCPTHVGPDEPWELWVWIYNEEDVEIEFQAFVYAEGVSYPLTTPWMPIPAKSWFPAFWVFWGPAEFDVNVNARWKG